MEHFDRFGEVMPDGRFTEPGNGKAYRLREARQERVFGFKQIAAASDKDIREIEAIVEAVI